MIKFLNNLWIKRGHTAILLDHARNYYGDMIVDFRPVGLLDGTRHCSVIDLIPYCDASNTFSLVCSQFDCELSHCRYHEATVIVE